MVTNKNTVSVILPTYNEAGNIITLLESIKSSVPNNWDYEIIVIDDNSPDNTFKLVECYANKNEFVVPILRKRNRGFAKSIEEGIKKARNEYVVVMDSDLTHDPVDLTKFLNVANYYDFVIGSRFCAGGVMQDKTHYFISMVYNWVIRLILQTQIQDNLGGYWVAKKRDICSLPMTSIFYGYGDYFYRLIFYIQLNNFTIAELPSKYLQRGKGTSKSRWLNMFFGYTFGAIALRFRKYRNS